jgi:hypothetical protein
LCPQGLVLMLFVDQSWLYWLSHSVWSVWIETLDQLNGQLAAKSHSVWSAWIEIAALSTMMEGDTSHSVWSAWIETEIAAMTLKNRIVALRMECVD